MITKLVAGVSTFPEEGVKRRRARGTNKYHDT